jgi:AcrR family transcriptional regulator
VHGATTHSPRRSPTEDAPGRTSLLDAAQHLILNEGYAAVTARRVAAQAGLKPQLVHYYFASMDELFVQLVRRDAAYGRAQLERALASAQPLRALWRLSTNPTITALSVEYLAVANHRKAIATEVAAAAEQFRLAQYEAFRQALDRHDLDTGTIPLGALLVALEGLARVIVMERNVGTHTFHDDAIGVVEDTLARLEGPAVDTGKRRS